MTTISGYNLTWLWLMYDLPYDTPKAKTDAARFLRQIKKYGFTWLISRSKFCVRYCSKDSAQKHIAYVKSIVPDDAEVRILQVTDKQFGRMQTFWGKMRKH